MGSIYRAVGMRPGLALHITDIHGNSLERTFLATSPPALSAPSCCVFQALHPFLSHSMAAPLCMHLQKLFFLLLSQRCRSSLVPWQRVPVDRKVGSHDVSPLHRLWSGDPGCAPPCAELPQRWLNFTGGALKG